MTHHNGSRYRCSIGTPTMHEVQPWKFNIYKPFCTKPVCRVIPLWDIMSARSDWNNTRRFKKTFACGLEDRLQVAINHYQLGHRLHRHVAKGQQVDGTDNRETNPKFLCHCFIAVIPIQHATLTRETVTTKSGVALIINVHNRYLTCMCSLITQYDKIS